MSSLRGAKSNCETQVFELSQALLQSKYGENPRLSFVATFAKNELALLGIEVLARGGLV